MYYCIDDLRINKFLLFRKCNSTFGRVIFSLVEAKEVLDSINNTTYNAIFQKSYNKQVSCKLVYNKVEDMWYIYSNNDTNISYKLEQATNDIVDILCERDIFTFLINGTFLSYKVVKIRKQYQLVLVEDMQSHSNHKIGTILTQNNSQNIVSVTTYDSKINKNAV